MTVQRIDACVLCDPERAAREVMRATVWEDRLWRLSTTRYGAIPGFSYLEPIRHIPHITDLGGDEASTFGSTIARVTGAVKVAMAASLVYLYVFGGGVPHLHVHLAPHREDDALNTAVIRGELSLETLPSGASVARSAEFLCAPRPRCGSRPTECASGPAGGPR